MTQTARRLVKRVFAESDGDLSRFLSMRLPSRADAEDLSQETYLRLLRVERTDLVRKPEALLFRIASNLVYEFYLKRSHRERSDTELVEGAASARRLTDERADTRRRIDAILERLRGGDDH